MKINQKVLMASLISIVFISGCLSNETDSLIGDYTRYVDAINSDARDLETSMTKWNTLMEQHNKGGSIDVSDLENAKREYTDKANIIKPKIESLKSFIVASEAKLRETGIDTFKEKQNLDELLAGMSNNVRNMQTELDKLSSSTSEEQTKVVSVYIDTLPSGVDPEYQNSIREAFGLWEKEYPHISFKETYKSSADIYVKWVKEFGTQTLGHTINKGFIEVGIGDSQCLGKWKPYTYNTVLWIAAHEIGHATPLGYPDDYNNTESIMYYQKLTKYKTDVDESDVIPASYARAYPVCTKNSAAEYSIEMSSTKPINIYVVPSKDDYELLTKRETFNHYPNCEGKEMNLYQKTCTISQGSYIVLENDAMTAVEFKIKANEL